MKNAVVDNLVKSLEEENLLLKENCADLETELTTSKDITETLEAKLAAVEAAAFNHYKVIQQWKEKLVKNEDEITALKNVIRNDKAENLKTNGELNQLKKTLKSKDKEIHNLEKTNSNQQDTMKTLKEASTRLKEEKNKLEKDIKKVERKVVKLEERKLVDEGTNNNLALSTFSTITANPVTSVPVGLIVPTTTSLSYSSTITTVCSSMPLGLTSTSFSSVTTNLPPTSSTHITSLCTLTPATDPHSASTAESPSSIWTPSSTASSTPPRSPRSTIPTMQDDKSTESSGITVEEAREIMDRVLKKHFGNLPHT